MRSDRASRQSDRHTRPLNQRIEWTFHAHIYQQSIDSISLWIQLISYRYLSAIYLRTVSKASNPFNFHISYIQWAILLIERHPHSHIYINGATIFGHTIAWNGYTLIVINCSRFNRYECFQCDNKMHALALRYNCSLFISIGLERNGSLWVALELTQWKPNGIEITKSFDNTKFYCRRKLHLATQSLCLATNKFQLWNFPQTKSINWSL